MIEATDAILFLLGPCDFFGWAQVQTLLPPPKVTVGI